MVYDRAAGNAFIRSFHVIGQIAGAVDSCDRTDGIDAAAGAFGPDFTSGLFVCQDQTNNNAGAPNAPQNYKLVPLQQIVDPAGPEATTTTTLAPVTTPTTAPCPGAGAGAEPVRLLDGRQRRQGVRLRRGQVVR